MDLRLACERVDYEAARLEQEYRGLLRRRQRSLARVLVASTGLVLSVTLPGELVQIGATLAGLALVNSTFTHVLSVRETLPELRRSDFFVAWRALYGNRR